MLVYLKHLPEKEILHNRGCGINFLQRRGKIPFGEVPSDTWLLREKLCDKIAIDISWSQLEPEEGHFLWDQPEWEGCFQSWIEAGFKVLLKVRGMDTLGTFYNQGTPQWVFDAGAKYVDEPIEFYRNTPLLNNIPGDTSMPIRYPVYWDDVYVEKASNLIHALGKRYNGKPFVETFAIAHTGRWGEMHIADRYPRDEWDHQGYSVARFLEAHRALIDVYRDAFPDTQLQQSIGDPSFQDTTADAFPNFDYLAKHGIIIKFGGLGKAWHPPYASPWLDDVWTEIFLKHRYESKLALENLVLPEALDFALTLGMNYWQRGGEAPGLGELNIEKDIPVVLKRIYSWYKFMPEKYEALTVEKQKEVWRNLARKTGYRLAMDSVDFERSGNSLNTRFVWSNSGTAPCFEKFMVRVAVCDKENNPVWSAVQKPACGCGAKIWDAGVKIHDMLAWTLPHSIPAGEYRLCAGLEHCSYGGEHIRLANTDAVNGGLYYIADLQIGSKIRK